MRWIYCWTILFFVAIAVPAKSQTCTQGFVPTTAFYINGVFNFASTAQRSRDKLRNALSEDLALDEDCLRVDMLYNRTEYGGDLLEAARQYLTDGTSPLVRWLSYRDVVPDQFEPVLLGFLAGPALAADYIVDSDRDEMVETVEAELDAGRNVILVAHSQGNFYANEVHDALYSRRGVRLPIVSVATPEPFVAGQERPYDEFYTTLRQDRVAALFPPDHLPANVDLETVSGDPLICLDVACHGFEDFYLADGTAARRKISEQVFSEIVAAEEVLFSEDFEQDPVGSFPTAWTRSFSGAGSAFQAVQLDPNNSNNRMLRLLGSSTSIFAAGAARPIDFSEGFSLELEIQNGTESFGSGHRERGYVYLRRGPSSGGRTLIAFRGSNVIMGQENVVLRSYVPGERYRLRIDYVRVGQQARTSYWINDEHVADTLGRSLSNELDLDHLQLVAQGGSALFDNVVVTRF